jgi:multidrug efflux system outer membrane protein
MDEVRNDGRASVALRCAIEEARGNRERVAVASDYLKLADVRFRAGVISYLEVLDAQRQLFAAQLDLNASEVNQRLAAVQLYRALGGGWKPG